MKKFTYVIKDPNGIHARPAGLLVKIVKGLSSQGTLAFGEKSVDMSKLFAVMSMGIKVGDQVTVSVEGNDEEKDITVLEKFFEENF